MLFNMTAEENSPQRKKSEAEVLSPKLSRAATTIAEEAVDQLQASEKLIAGMCEIFTKQAWILQENLRTSDFEEDLK